MSTYYVSTESGNDACNRSNDPYNGNSNNPFKTIQKASSLVKSGDTIIVYPGIYRERIVPLCSGITYKGINNPIIRGSCPWSPTNFSNNICSGIIDDSLFTDLSHVDGANPFEVPFSVTPYGINGLPEYNMKEAMIPKPDPSISFCLGQVFVNDEYYTQKGTEKDMRTLEKTWWYNTINKTLYIHLPLNIFDLSTIQIEITNQRRLFAPHKRGLKYITIDNFIFERCGNNYPNKFWVNPANQQAGAIGTRSGSFWTIMNNTIRYASGIGIDWGNEGCATQDIEIGVNGSATGSYGHIISNNIISDNGASGTAAYMAKNVTFINNTVTRNNNLQFYGKHRWESAGVKVHCPTGSIIANNIIMDNYCHGIWSDQGAGLNSFFKENILVNNKGSGINFEIGVNTTGNVILNVFDKNINGITFSTSGGVTVLNNLFLSSQLSDIETILFTRPDKWTSDNIKIYNNIFTSSPTYLRLSQKDTTIPSNRYMNNNKYYCNVNDMKFSIIGQNLPITLSIWTTYWLKSNNGIDSDENSKCLVDQFQIENNNDYDFYKKSLIKLSN